MNPTLNNENQIEPNAKKPKKSLAKKISLIILGMIIAVGIGFGIWIGIETDRQITTQSNYRVAASDVNDIIVRYNETAGLGLLSTNSTNDADTMKAQAAEDAKQIEEIVTDINLKAERLNDNKIFSDDKEAKELIDSFLEQEKQFEAFFKVVIESCKLRAKGDFSEAAEKILSADANNDNDFVNALNELAQYLVRKANGE